jgi:hypothetical protein
VTALHYFFDGASPVCQELLWSLGMSDLIQQICDNAFNLLWFFSSKVFGKSHRSESVTHDGVGRSKNPTIIVTVFFSGTYDL